MPFAVSFVLSALILLSSCGKFMPESSWHKDNLKGKVNTITEYNYGSKLFDWNVYELKGITTYHYDRQGRKIKELKYDSDSTKKYVHLYKYDEDGYLTQIEARESNGETDYIVDYTYNYRGLATKEELRSFEADTLAMFFLTNYTYDYEGHIKHSIVINQKYNTTWQYVDTMTYTYDNENRISSYSTHGAGSRMNAKCIFEYDKYDNITTRKCISDNNNIIFTELYDYEYDSIGNWIKREKTFIDSDTIKEVKIRQIEYYD